MKTNKILLIGLFLLSSKIIVAMEVPAPSEPHQNIAELFEQLTEQSRTGIAKSFLAELPRELRTELANFYSQDEIWQRILDKHKDNLFFKSHSLSGRSIYELSDLEKLRLLEKLIPKKSPWGLGGFRRTEADLKFVNEDINALLQLQVFADVANSANMIAKLADHLRYKFRLDQLESIAILNAPAAVTLLQKELIVPANRPELIGLLRGLLKSSTYKQTYLPRNLQYLTIRNLFNAGVDPNIDIGTEDNSQYPLQLLIQNNFPAEIVQLLIARGAVLPK